MEITSQTLEKNRSPSCNMLAKKADGTWEKDPDKVGLLIYILKENLTGSSYICQDISDHRYSPSLMT